MNRKLLKFSLVCATGALVLAANPKKVMAYEEPVAGFPYDKMGGFSSNSENDTLTNLSLDNIPIPGFSNIGIADVDTNLLVRSGPDANKKIVGKLPKNGGCEILEKDKGGWTKIKSGKVTGYVKSEYLITGDKAAKLALKVGDYIATANVNGLFVRKETSVNSEALDQVAKGEELIVLDSMVATYGEEHVKWVKVSLDSDDNAEGSIGYVAKEYVDLSYQLKKATSMEEIQYGSGVSSTRANLINYAKQFLGNPYVWGGTSLTRGTDCSGFTRGIYAKYGISLPRVSRDQARGGTRVSTSSLKAGDLVFYGNSSSGYINHVAIYIGNGKIIHASNRRDGIKISNMYYRTPVKCVRYFK